MENFFYKLETFLKERVSRGTFLKICLGGLAAFVSGNAFLKAAFAQSAESSGRPGRKVACNCDLAVAEGQDPYQNTVKVIAALGGMEKFVKKGDIVVVKPNIGWDRSPEQGANTEPRVVAALIDMCYKAGAKRVNVFDVTCNDERRCYENSGIKKAAVDSGAQVYFPNHWNVVKASFPHKSPMQGWPVLRDAVDCNVFINVPVLKNHALTNLTLSMKNLMGVCSGNRGTMHVDIGRKLADMAGFIKPELTVIDATRVLTRNGPTGGNLADVLTMNRVFASADPVLADSYAASLMNIDPMSISYIKEAAIRGLGMADFSKANVAVFKL